MDVAVFRASVTPDINNYQHVVQYYYNELYEQSIVEQVE